jgi:hypothetical protein
MIPGNDGNEFLIPPLLPDNEDDQTVRAAKYQSGHQKYEEDPDNENIVSYICHLLRKHGTNLMIQKKMYKK